MKTHILLIGISYYYNPMRSGIFRLLGTIWQCCRQLLESSSSSLTLSGMICQAGLSTKRHRCKTFSVNICSIERKSFFTIKEKKRTKKKKLFIYFLFLVEKNSISNKEPEADSDEITRKYSIWHCCSYTEFCAVFQPWKLQKPITNTPWPSSHLIFLLLSSTTILT